MSYHLYAHWLDSEYRRSGSRVSSQSGIQRLLKIHALLGTQIVLSDIQLIDSYGVIESFQDPKFLRVIKDHPDTLGFSAHADSEDEPTLSRLIAGFRRSLRPDWRATALETKHVKTLAETLVARGTHRVLADPNSIELQHLYQACPGLQAVLLAIKHFADHRQFVYPSASPGGSFTPLLKQAAEETLRQDSPLNVAHHRLLQQTLEVVGRVGPQATRSQVLATLAPDDMTIRPGTSEAAIWQTIVHAWNSNVQRSVISPILGAPMRHGGGSIGSLPEGVPVGRYIDVDRDALIQASEPPASPLVAGYFPVDPGVLDWSVIGKLREKTDETRVGYQNALASQHSEAVYETLQQHLAKLSEAYSEMHPPLGVPWGYDVLVLLFGGFFVAFGGPMPPIVQYAALNVHRFLSASLAALSWEERTLMVTAIQDQAPIATPLGPQSNRPHDERNASQA